MDRRYLIYDGFENDIESLFEDLISKFHLVITYRSDSGVFFENKRIILEISYDTGLQIWLKIKQLNLSEMVAKLCMIKGEIVYQQFKALMFSMGNTSEEKKDSLIQLSQFLIDHFSEELSED